MNETLIFGKGWIGSRLAASFGCNSIDRQILTYEDIQEEIEKNKPKAIINCIGYYGKNVDSCEENKTKSLFANSFIPLLMAEAAIRNGIKLVHISSGYLYTYDSALNKPISEEEVPDYFDLFYSRTKLYSEAAILSLKESADILLLRVGIVLDFIPHPRNILTKLLTFPSVIDIPNSITYLPDFIEGMKHLMRIGAEGVFNMVNYGGLKFRELLEEYRKYNPNHSYAITSLNEIKLVRPNIILSTDKLEETGFQVRDIHEILPECIEKYIGIIKSNGQQLI